MMKSLSQEHMQVILDVMGSTETVNRRRLIIDNIDVLVASLTPFLKLLIQEAPNDTLRCQTHLNGCTLCSETARALVEKGRIDEAKRMAKEDLEWARTIFPILRRMSDESQANSICTLILIHANEYRRLGLEDEARQAYRLVDQYSMQ